MTYHHLSIPDKTCSEDVSLVRYRLEPFLRDVHAMLRLPIRDNPGLDTPCGLSAALILLEVVAGVSMELYLRPGEHRGNRKGGHELRFIEVLKKHFPWTHEPITPDDAAKILYHAYRNPLAHNLGIVNDPNVKPAGIAIVGGNAPLPEEDIEAIERCANMPSGEPTLQRIHDATDRWKLNIKCFYCGVRTMIESVMIENVEKHRAAVPRRESSRGEVTLSSTQVVQPVMDEYKK